MENRVHQNVEGYTHLFQLACGQTFLGFRLDVGSEDGTAGGGYDPINRTDVKDHPMTCHFRVLRRLTSLHVTLHQRSSQGRVMWSIDIASIEPVDKVSLSLPACRQPSKQTDLCTRGIAIDLHEYYIQSGLRWKVSTCPRSSRGCLRLRTRLRFGLWGYVWGAMRDKGLGSTPYDSCDQVCEKGYHSVGILEVRFCA